MQNVYFHCTLLSTVLWKGVFVLVRTIRRIWEFRDNLSFSVGSCKIQFWPSLALCHATLRPQLSALERSVGYRRRGPELDLVGSRWVRVLCGFIWQSGPSWIVQRVDNAIHRINHYGVLFLLPTIFRWIAIYPFEQPGPACTLKTILKLT